ncbi:MAG: FAD-dependent oxidoreductase [Parvularculaceae bacterium]|nr:FAD-dependent oxidoreductase [Parvularculaceae bacterium]
MTDHMVIIGGGQAGCQAAISLRQAGFDGDVTLIGEEPALPYQRPPLSKAYLKGELAEERLYFRPADFFEGQSIEVRTGVRVASIDREAKTVHLADGEALSYTKLLITTGAPPRRLPVPGADLDGVRYLRSLKDADDLRSILSADGRVAIIGAGYIGLEVAAVARAAGREVTVLEMADRVLKRVASPELSSFYQELHTNKGVDIRLGAAVEAVTGEGGRVTGITLSTGETIACSSVLVGIGAVPCTELAQGAGLKCDNGIRVNEHACTEDPNVFAAGDCSHFPSPRYGRSMRLESVPNAIEQGKVAGANMAGGEAVHDALPWFWSDQYEAKLQTVGLAEGATSVITRGDPAAGSFSLWSFQGDKLLSVDAVNDPPAFAVGKKVLATGAAVAPDEISDPKFDLRVLMKR